MGDPFLGQITIFSFTFAPKGWAQCNGQLLPINQNQALFSLLGTTYGGNGQTNFALPDLRGRVSMHMGQGPGLAGYTLGERGGQESVTLTIAQMPQHRHVPVSSIAAGTETSPAGNFWARDSGNNAIYSTVGGTAMPAGAIKNKGNSQPHNNLAPLLTLNFCIALQGIFPSRD
ncbi:MAG TPA: tail fiber protein [Vicinamibacterales bacterium]|jgi:microcystin-dependent protein